MSADNDPDPPPVQQDELWQDDIMTSGHWPGALPDGSSPMELSDWCHGTLRGSFVVRPWADDTEWYPFVNVRAQPVSGDPQTISMPAHTNIPRSGDSGLPNGWEMHVHRWRAVINLPLTEPVMRWASEAHVQFEYNARRLGDATLLDLLLEPQTIGGALAIRMREQLSYSVRVEAGTRVSMENFRHWLQEPEREVLAMHAEVAAALNDLESLIRVGRHLGSGAEMLVAGMRGVQERLKPGRKVTCWIHLIGPLKRSVV